MQTSRWAIRVASLNAFETIHPAIVPITDGRQLRLSIARYGHDFETGSRHGYEPIAINLGTSARFVWWAGETDTSSNTIGESPNGFHQMVVCRLEICSS